MNRRTYANDWRETNSARRTHIHGPLLPMDTATEPAIPLSGVLFGGIIAVFALLAVGFGW